MLRLATLLALMLAALITNGQDINITFSATSAAIRIDSVTATNLATDESILLPGNETLLLTPKTGIPIIMEDALHGMIFPNPFSGTTRFIAGVTESQSVFLKIRNLVGQIVVQIEALAQPGMNEFILSLSAEGIYWVSLTTKQGTTGFKVICTGSSGSANSIRYAGFRSDNGYKSQPASYTLGYSAGDTIQYRCRSGNFTAIFTDSPLESKKYTVEFPPIANFVVDPGEGTTETKFAMDATGCSDAETLADDLEIRWDFDGDGNWETDYEISKYSGFQFQWAGSYSIILEVKDASGLTDADSVAISIEASPQGTFTDPRDFNKYPYKSIGTQVWMTRDMAWLPEVSPPSVESDTARIYYVFGYEGASAAQAKASPNYLVYGALYNGVSAKDACPVGWHTASDLDWKVLEKYLGMSDADLNVSTVSFRESGSAGGQLKESGTVHWWNPNVGATNSSGFNALPGACRQPPANPQWGDLGYAALYWTSTEGSEGHTWQRCLVHENAGVLRFNEANTWGMSVRCIRDAANTPPTANFFINPTQGTTENTFVLNASGCTDAETITLDLEVRWDFDGDGTWDTDFSKSKVINHQYSLAKAYSARMEVKDSGELTDEQIQTVSVVYPTFTDLRDGNIYPYKTIGNQVWMVRNLAWLPEVSPPAEGSNTTKFYYVTGYNGTNVTEAKQSAAYPVYGVLYSGLAARDACPDGWHTATDEEWIELEMLLGMSDVEAHNSGDRNSGAVGIKLREEGRSHWGSNPLVANNPVGFTALPGGTRDLLSSSFYGVGIMAHFWTGTSAGDMGNYYRWIAGSGVSRYNDGNGFGMAVRCIRD